MYDEYLNCEITIGRGTFDNPEFINGVTVQCKNCNHWGESKHCGVMPSERFDGESWCSTSYPKQFFSPKGVKKNKECELAYSGPNGTDCDGFDKYHRCPAGYFLKYTPETCPECPPKQSKSVVKVNKDKQGFFKKIFNILFREI